MPISRPNDKPSIMVSSDQRREGEKLAEKVFNNNAYELLTSRFTGLASFVDLGGDGIGLNPNQWNLVGEELAILLACAMKLEDLEMESRQKVE